MSSVRLKRANGLPFIVQEIDVDLAAAAIAAPVFKVRGCLDVLFLWHFAPLDIPTTIQRGLDCRQNISRLSACLTHGEIYIHLSCQPIRTASTPALIHFSPSANWAGVGPEQVALDDLALGKDQGNARQLDDQVEDADRPAILDPARVRRQGP